MADMNIYEKSLYAFLREKSAQIGERFDWGIFQQYKKDSPDEFSDDLYQARACIQAFLDDVVPAIEKELFSASPLNTGYQMRNLASAIIHKHLQIG